jgi:RNA polymerase sigma-70 factor, ECF subfamily
LTLDSGNGENLLLRPRDFLSKLETICLKEVLRRAGESPETSSTAIRMDELPLFPAFGLRSGAEGGERVCSDEFVRTFVRHQRDIHAFILSLVPNWADAEDIFQETSTRLFQQGDRCTSIDAFLPWARTVAYYQVLSYRKQHRRRSQRFAEVCLDLIAESHNEAEAADGRRQALLSCLGKLEAAARRLLELAYRGDLSVAEVAHRVGQNTTATYKSLSRIRHRLRICVDRSLSHKERP